MEWIDVKDQLPNSEEFEDKNILVLVNGNTFIAHVAKRGSFYVIDNRFFYSPLHGWHGDKRFAKPTHWMPLPEVPNGMD